MGGSPILKITETKLLNPLDPDAKPPFPCTKFLHPSTMTSTALPTPTTFPAFSRFPADIRHEIWRTAATTPRANVPGVCILTFSQPGQHGPLVVHEPRNPLLLQVSTEAYAITASSPPPAPRPFNPAIDTLYLGPSEFIYFTDHLIRRPSEEVPWFREIRHVALSLAVADRGLALPMTIMYLHKLASIAVVYPGVEGTWDFETDTSYVEDDEEEGEEEEEGGEEEKGDGKTEEEDKEEEGDEEAERDTERRGLVLTRLTDQEAEKCIIEADYVYETHGGDERIVWRRNAKEHIRFVQNTLDNFMARAVAMERDQRRVPPMWDRRNMTLKVEYRAVAWYRVYNVLEFDSSEEGGEVAAEESCT